MGTIEEAEAFMKKGDRIDAKDLGLCPCGKKIAASTDPPAVIHAVPYCKEFLYLEPDEFLTYVRRSRGIPDPTPE